MPIPNFTGGPNMGLAGGLREAMGTSAARRPACGTMSTPLAVVASNEGSKGSGAINPAVLAQLAGTSAAPAAAWAADSPTGPRFRPGGWAAAPRPTSTASST